jgi:hypothetical protein
LVAIKANGCLPLFFLLKLHSLHSFAFAFLLAPLRIHRDISFSNVANQPISSKSHT